jgi:hypothetical protein
VSGITDCTEDSACRIKRNVDFSAYFKEIISEEQLSAVLAVDCLVRNGSIECDAFNFECTVLDRCGNKLNSCYIICKERLIVKLEGKFFKSRLCKVI